MKAETHEWVRCAEEDFSVAQTQFRSRQRPRANGAIGFHSQQCAEKYLKARLVEAGQNIPKVHDLMLLLQRALSLEPLWASFAPALRGLNDYAVRFRYPGHVATRQDAREALAACRSFRAEARLSLGLPKK